MKAFIQPQHPNEYGAIEKLNKLYLESIDEKPIVIYTGGKKRPGYKKISAPKLKVTHMLLFFIFIWSIWGAIYRFRLSRYLKKNGVKTVIVNHSATHYILSKRMNKKFNFILSQHTGLRNYLFEDIPFLGWLFSLFQRPETKIRRMAGYNTFTEEDKKNFVDRFNLDPQKVNVIPNFLSKTKVKKINWKSRKKDILFFGRFDELDKNIIKTIDFSYRNKIDIDMYGSGRKKLIKLAKECEYSHYKGFTRKSADKINVDYKYNILISNPLLEGYSLATLEAMQVGTIPIINSRDAQYPFGKELIKKGLAIPYDEFDKTKDYSQISKKVAEFVNTNNSIEMHISLINKVFDKYN